jgi:hypothetical protein
VAAVRTGVAILALTAALAALVSFSGAGRAEAALGRD